MKLLIIDDDQVTCENIRDLLTDYSYKVELYLYGREESGECGLRKALQDLTDKDYILLDLFLNEQAERAVPFREIRSVKLASELRLPKGHIIFYSNGNVREIEPLFEIVPGCHYLPIRGEYFERNDKIRYDKYENNRRDFLQKISEFTKVKRHH